MCVYVCVCSHTCICVKVWGYLTPVHESESQKLTSGVLLSHYLTDLGAHWSDQTGWPTNHWVLPLSASPALEKLAWILCGLWGSELRLSKMPRNDFWTLHAYTRSCTYIHEYVHTYKHTQASCAARSQLTILHVEWHLLYFEQQSINVCSGPKATLQTQDVISHSGFNYSFLKKWCWISFHIIWRF